MEYISLGRAKMLVSRVAFGAMSLDCKEIEDFGPDADEKVSEIVHKAYEGGMNFFDLSHTRPECERRLGAALHGIRHNVNICTKSAAQTVSDLRRNLEESLELLESDSVELYEFDNLGIVPKKDGPDGLYNEMLRLQQKGEVGHIGFATESVELAQEAVESGLYDAVQFPFSILTDKKSQDLVRLCAERDVGCVASQPLCGGLVANIPLALGFFLQFENVSPVWGVHTMEELEQILYFNSHPPVIDEQFKKEVERERFLFN
ncbi:MAG: aldo/keto reductase [Treponema sp.]|nr:aldo/keto reductase [Treponema sp.]